MDRNRELEAKKAAYEEVLSTTYRDEDAAVVQAYVTALEGIARRYFTLSESVDGFFRQALTSQLLGPHLVERRGDGQRERRSSAGGHLPLRRIPELNYPCTLGGPEGVEVQVEREALLAGDSKQFEEFGSGGGVEELAGQGASEERKSPPE